MATASRIVVDTQQQPVYAVPGLTTAQADKTSELLQENHEQHHIFFNDKGFHNHIVHHQLSLYATGASVEAMQKQYQHNVSYQRPAIKEHAQLAVDMQDAATFTKHLGQALYYPDYLEYFRRQIEAKGWKETINECLLKGDARADDMLVRCYSGLIHPLIHLGFGIEFEQPAVIAEALAQAAVHENRLAPLFLRPEELASQRARAESPPTLYSLLQRLWTETDTFGKSIYVADDDLFDAVLKRALEPFAELAAQYTVSPSTLRQQTHELIQATAFLVFAPHNSGNSFRADFLNMHSVNCSIFFSRFIDADWISESNKVRLLEWKARHALATFVQSGAPELSWQRVLDYRPLHEQDGWPELLRRGSQQPEDGHLIKLLRALAHGAQLSGPDTIDGVRLDPAAWLRMGHMAVDACESSDPWYVFGTGLEQAWGKAAPQN